MTVDWETFSLGNVCEVSDTRWRWTTSLSAMNFSICINGGCRKYFETTHYSRDYELHSPDLVLSGSFVGGVGSVK